MVVQLGDWTADRPRGRFLRGDDQHAVEPKVMDLLFALASEPGRVFGQDELRRILWSDVVVGDDSLLRCISKLRAALRRLDGRPASIETVPKRGYWLKCLPPPPPPRRMGASGHSGWRIAAMLAGVALFLAGLALLAPTERAEGVDRAEIDQARHLMSEDAARQQAISGENVAISPRRDGTLR